MQKESSASCCMFPFGIVFIYMCMVYEFHVNSGRPLQESMAGAFAVLVYLSGLTFLMFGLFGGFDND